ncbi:hypothetical protein QBC35DRAFT_76442 [Podospora australis]|uniref:Uncharacterized protein n=1 Tax=Podospora australis TaxID=1536484 RepID=A0AAN7AFL0_9PEZI|nr:hypothetical protein QBC35DRAFT_76442 [Podospora australis]
MDNCEPLSGNADFYGLGIRIGIYLLWGSTWLSLLLNPESAQSVLDVNSVTVFAVAIATIIAANRDAPAVEIYIMLQILIGFPVTTLSSIGIRLWLMTPRRFDKLINETSRLWREDVERRREARQTRLDNRQDPQTSPQPVPAPQPGHVSKISYWISVMATIVMMGLSGLIRYLYTSLPSLPLFLPLRLLSSLKFPGLVWSGVLWRTTTVALIMVYNLVYWFDEAGHGVQQPAAPGCGPPTIFMFSMQPLEGRIIILGRTAGVIMAVIVGPPTYTLVILTIKVFGFALAILYRDAYYFLSLGDPQTFGEILDRVNKVLNHEPLFVTQLKESYSVFFPLEAITGLTSAGGSIQRSLLDLLEFMSSYDVDHSIRFLDVIKVGVSLGMGKPVKRHSQAQNHEPRVSRAQTMPEGWGVSGVKGTSRGRFLSGACILVNIAMVLSIVWFIISIETTIRWNGIQGVNTIDSTGQLIPFVMGCVSASQVIKKVTLLALAKVSHGSFEYQWEDKDRRQKHETF